MEINPKGFQYGELEFRKEETIKIYLIKQDEWGPHVCKDYRPAGNRWKNIETMEDYHKAEYLIVISNPVVSIANMFPPEKQLYFIGEPTEFNFCKKFWENVPEGAHKFPTEEYGYPMHWHVQLNYDELKNMSFPEKTKNLSWVTTPFGDGYEQPGCQVLSGHKIRMNFLKVFLQKYPDKMYLFGRKMTRYLIPGYFKYFGGELWDKYDGVRDFRYTIALENSVQKNYVTDKFADGVLSGCLVFHWGCPNIADLYPKGSYVWVDIEKPEEAADKIVEISKSDLREQNLDEIEAAKQLVLDKYNIWENIYKAVNHVYNENF